MQADPSQPELARPLHVSVRSAYVRIRCCFRALPLKCIAQRLISSSGSHRSISQANTIPFGAEDCIAPRRGILQNVVRRFQAILDREGIEPSGASWRPAPRAARWMAVTSAMWTALLLKTSPAPRVRQKGEAGEPSGHPASPKFRACFEALHVQMTGWTVIADIAQLLRLKSFGEISGATAKRHDAPLRSGPNDAHRRSSREDRFRRERCGQRGHGRCSSSNEYSRTKYGRWREIVNSCVYGSILLRMNHHSPVGAETPARVIKCRSLV